MTRLWFNRWPAVWVGMMMMVLSGCAGYRLGPSNGMSAGDRSIQVNLFQNDTLEPRLTEAVGTALRRRLQHDGTFRLNTRGDGDVVLNGRIIDYRRLSVSFEPQDLLTARDLELHVAARVTAVVRATGKTLLDRDVTSRTTVRQGADSSAAERQAVPLLAEDLARDITSLLVDGEW